MPSELIVPGTSSEIEDGLKKVFRTAVAGGDAQGAAAVARELRKREEAADNKENPTTPYIAYPTETPVQMHPAR